MLGKPFAALKSNLAMWGISAANAEGAFPGTDHKNRPHLILGIRVFTCDFRYWWMHSASQWRSSPNAISRKPARLHTIAFNAYQTGRNKARTGDPMKPATGTLNSKLPSAMHAAVLLFCVSFAVLASAILGPVLPAMTLHFASVPNIQTLVPVIVTAPMLALAVVGMFAGGASDRLGRKRLLLASLALYGFAGTAPCYLDSINAIIATRVLVGVAEAGIMACSTALIGDYFSGTQRDRYMSLQTTVASFSAFSFNAIGGLLGQAGWRVPFAVYALAFVMFALVAVFIWDTKGNPEAHARAVAGDAPGISFRPALLAWICFAAFVVGAAFMMVPVHMAFMLVDVGTTEPARIGMAYAVNSLGVIIGTLVFGWVIVSRFRVAVQMAMGCVVVGIGFLLMAAAKDFEGMLLGGFVNGLGCGVVLPLVVTWNVRELPFSKRGFGLGAFFSMNFLGNFINPLVVMPFVATLGSRAAVVHYWGVGSLMVAVAAAGYCVMRAKPQQAVLA
jgi:MFS family permease